MTGIDDAQRFMRRAGRVSACLLAAFLGLSWPSVAQNLEESLEKEETPPEDGTQLELPPEVTEGTLFRLVPWDKPEESLSGRLYWRRFGGYLAVQTAPVRVMLGEKDVIAPRTAQHPKTAELFQVYPTEGRQTVSPGKHVVRPGDLPLVSEGTITSTHPAIRIAGDEVHILCAPARLEVLDAAGKPVPAPLQVSWGEMKLLREDGIFNPLILWLPVGLAYKSTLGSFRVTAEGKVEASPAELREGVTVTAEGLRLVLPARGGPPTEASEPAVAPDPKVLHLVSHRGRRVYAWDETATYAVVVPRGSPGGEAHVRCRLHPSVPGDARDLGVLSLPPVPDRSFDSRVFRLSLAAIPPGTHELWIECGQARSQPQELTVVPWYPRSPFFVHSRSGCIEPWPGSDEGFRVLRDAGLEMGADTPLDAEMPRLDPARLAALARASSAVPPETALTRSPNDVLLERMLRYQLRAVELIVTRSAYFYNEGLSYHHSYPPSIDRMIRRLHVFTQQTADYPSFWGVNYSWYPQLFGYAEAAVPTDAHVHDRNVALARNLANAGYSYPKQKETQWYQENRLSDDPAAREKADLIRRQAIRYSKAQMDFGFGRHNKLYNDAVRQMRPQTVFTLFENAGHDAMKWTRSLFHDMAACCYESYTDFGEWVMSAAFTTDWARGNAPGRPVWITTDWGTSSEGMMKSLFHAFGRGLAGGGVPMASGGGFSELARRGKGLRFISQYGAIAAHAMPDRRFAILATDAQQVFNGRAPYVYHSVYGPLTRLGCPPAILDEQTVAESGIPADTKVLFLVREQDPLEPAVAQALATFQKRGGKVAMTKDCRVKPEGATVMDCTPKHIWELSGFAWKTHSEMWNEFESAVRGPLGKALAELGVPAAATTDPDRGLVVTMDAGPVRYAIVLADKRGAHFADFEPTEALPVSLEGVGWTVRNLVHQTSLPTTEKAGRTEVTVDLVTEPTTVLALYRSAPAGIRLKTSPTPALGTDLRLTADVSDAARASIGPVPVTWTVLDTKGQERFVAHRAAGDEVRFPIAQHDDPGTWTVHAQELLTGLRATARIQVRPSPTPPAAVSPADDVHVVDPAHLHAFAAHPGEKRVIVEPGRRDLIPIARQLADALGAAGIPTRLWDVRPEEFNTVPMRFYPRPEDAADLARIAAGNLIGYRENMEAYIDRKNRRNVPEKGGYAEIEPHFMIGQDCVLFSGGILAESLRAVTPWMNTPNVPGRGQGRLVTVFSPFMADRHVVAVVANDREGTAKAAARLAMLLASRPPQPPAPGPADPLQETPAETATAPVAQPYVNYTPVRRVQRLLVGNTGRAVVLLSGKKDNVAFVDETGKLQATLAVPGLSVVSAGTDAEGQLWNGFHEPPQGKRGTYQVTLQGIRPDGRVNMEFVAYEGHPAHLGPHNAVAAFPVAPNGQFTALGRLGGMLLGDLPSNRFSLYDDIPHVRRTFEVWTPRFPTAMTFSPDSQYLLFTMDTRPTGYENMHQRLNRPEGAETTLIEVPSGKRVWSLRGQPAVYATANGFAALSAGAEVAAFTDIFGTIFLVDKSGRILYQEEIFPKQYPNEFTAQPPQGVGTWISRNGKLAAFGFRDFLVLVDGKSSARLAGSGLISAAVAPDATFAVAGWYDGTIQAVDPQGKVKWSARPGGVGPHIAVSPNGTVLVGTSDGDLVAIDSAGQELRRTRLAEAADQARHAVQRPEGSEPRRPPFLYRDPRTLELAIERLKARKAAAWAPAGEGRDIASRTFYPLNARVELQSGPAREAFIHMVYHRPQENKTLHVTVSSGNRRDRFVLDRPTPGYRIIDIPIRGPEARIAVEADGPAEAADISVWTFQWPGPNLAYVRPPDTGTSSPGGLLTEDRDDKGENLEVGAPEFEEDGSGTAGRAKDCRVWSPNPDIDKISGQWLASPVDGLLIVNGTWWDPGARPWAQGPKFVGEWFTANFGKPVTISLVATYDWTRKQSEVTANLAVYSGQFSGDRAQGAAVLGAAIENDQFWRLFSFKPTQVSLLGAYVYTGGPGPEGLSEVEAYR